MRIVINVPARLARDIIAQAHSRYWLDNYSYRVRADGNGLYLGKPVKGGEADNTRENPGSEVPAPRPYIGAAAIAEGLRIMLEAGSGDGPGEAAARILEGTNDGPDADVLLQYAAYGRLIWG